MMDKRNECINKIRQFPERPGEWADHRRVVCVDSGKGSPSVKTALTVRA